MSKIGALAERWRESDDEEKRELALGYLQIVKRNRRAVRDDAVLKERARGKLEKQKENFKKAVKHQALEAVKDWYDGGMVEAFPIDRVEAALNE